MNKLLKIMIYVWVSFIVVACLATKSKVEPEHSVAVDLPAFKYVNQFIGYGSKYNVNTKMINDSIDDIVFYPLRDITYGLYSSENRQIVLNNQIAEDTIVLKKIIFHELGHLFGLEHGSIGIMQTHLEPYDIHKRYCPLEGGTLWENDVEKLFNDIKNLNKK